jgi:multiple sugar transport system substrate-binding protein
MTAANGKFKMDISVPPPLEYRPATDGRKTGGGQDGQRRATAGGMPLQEGDPGRGPWKGVPGMTEYELLRVINFLEKARTPYMAMIPTADEDPSWNMLLYLMKQNLTGSVVTTSALASVARIPYATAMRRIHGLIEQGYIVRKPVSRTGKSFALCPSPALAEAFLQYAKRMKALLAETFGLRKEQDEEQFYFGGSYLAAQIIPPPRLVESLFRSRHEMKFLLNDDNYFGSMCNMWSDYRNNMASRRHFDMRKLPDLFAQLVENARQPVSQYDIVAVNMPWLGEMVDRKLVRPLDDLIERSYPSHPDFHPSVWSMGRWKGKQYGIPLYCTVELLAARSDLFSGEDLKYPVTFDETVDMARRFHRPSKERYGIAWNGAEGMPIASTFMILMGCCGETILNLPKSRTFFTVDEARAEELRPNINSEAGMQVLDYLHRLIEYSPPNVLDMDWDQRTEVFLTGHAAMAYCWTVRAARFEYDINSVVKRKVTYLQHPRGPHGSHNNSIGGFLLSIPSNLPDDQVELAFEGIAWMTSPEAMKANVQNGFPVAPRFSVNSDPEASATSPIVRVVDKLAKRNLLSSLSRPAVPGFLEIETILGSLVHKALRREIGDAEALAQAQDQVDKAMRAAGHY